MKKKILFIATLVGMSMFIGCQRFDFEEAHQEAIRQNAENIFGKIDPNQDWNSSVSGTVTITADASLKTISRVQILTESPFMNPNAQVVAEAEVQKGQSVTLNYDVLNSYTRLMAACIDNEGHYHVKGFNIGDEKVSFKSSATTRAAARRASSDIDLSAIELKYDNSFMSYNALRTLSDDNKYSSWKGKNWEKDRLWWAAGSVSNEWTMSNSTIYRDATPLSDEDTTTLNEIFSASLGRYDYKTNGDKDPRNNLKLINESSAVKLYGNHLVSNGKAPLTLCPVQLASTEAYWCDIYYYYYRTEDIPAGTTEADYIKTLPKFKAIDLNDERKAFSAVTGVAVNEPDTNFCRQHEYLLPFYGNASEFAEEPTEIPPTLNSYGYTTNKKFYRIYNYSGNSKAKPDPIPESKHYITYGTKTENLKAEYTDNIEYQLWQIFTNAKDNTMMLYNVGSKKFMWWNNNGEYVEFKDIAENSLKNYTVYLTDGKWNPYAIDKITEQKVYIYSAYKNNCIKALIDTGREYLYRGGTNISGDYQITREWTFEEYKAESYPAEAITDFDLPLKYFSTTYIETPHESISAIIPEGYRIGFMIRKDNGKKTEEMGGDKRGCLYGYGELNKEINTYGQFKTAVTKFKMAEDSPRMATFTANGKTYLCFEEGADAQFSDVIVELGGYDTDVYESDPTGNSGSGQSTATRMLYDEIEPEGTTYMLLFEDRATSADYDMNDVVLRCRRQTGVNSGRVDLSLVAAGGLDEVEIRGIEGTYVKGYELNEKEVHEIFDVNYATGYDRFVNTVDGKPVIDPCKGVYELPAGMTIPQFLAKIYIVNKTTGDVIRVPKTGAEPLAIIMPFDFKYPKERQMITGAYTEFLQWAQDATGHNDWYNHIEENTVYPIDNIISK